MVIEKVCKGFTCLKGELIIHLYGGASSIREDDFFNIGQRNIEATKLALMKLNMKTRNEDIERTVSRTVSMDVSTGNVKVLYQPLRI